MNVTKSNIRFVVTGLLFGIFMASLDQTIVSTAMPTIVSELGGLEKFIWVFSAYMIASVVSMPLFGKLSDMYGRKRFFLFGLSVFLLGSILSGTAENMLQLIIYRAIQGIGGGSMMPISFAIIFDIFPAEKRGKMQGLFGAVFGLSSVFGPIIGAYFTDYINWRWIFYINVPIGIASFVLLFRYYVESIKLVKKKIDWLGTIILVFSILSLMFALELGGKEYAWNSLMIISLFISFALLLFIFLQIEQRVEEPVVPIALFKRRLFTSSQGVSFLYGAMLISGATYIPLFVQGVFGGTASSAGQILTPMMLGVVTGSQIGGFSANKFTYRRIMLGSVLLLLIAMSLLSTLSVDTSRLLVTLYMIIAGMGIGISFPIMSLTSLHQLEMNQRGSATSTVVFFRTIGSALGVTVFGAIQTQILKTQLQNMIGNSPMASNIVDPRVLLQPEVRATIPSFVLDKMTLALADSIATVFQWSLIAVIAAFIFILLMGNDRMETKQVELKRKTG